MRMFKPWNYTQLETALINWIQLDWTSPLQPQLFCVFNCCALLSLITAHCNLIQQMRLTS